MMKDRDYVLRQLSVFIHNRVASLSGMARSRAARFRLSRRVGPVVFSRANKIPEKNKVNH